MKKYGTKGRIVSFFDNSSKKSQREKRKMGNKKSEVKRERAFVFVSTPVKGEVEGKAGYHCLADEYPHHNGKEPVRLFILAEDMELVKEYFGISDMHNFHMQFWVPAVFDDPEMTLAKAWRFFLACIKKQEEYDATTKNAQGTLAVLLNASSNFQCILEIVPGDMKEKIALWWWWNFVEDEPNDEWWLGLNRKLLTVSHGRLRVEAWNAPYENDASNPRLYFWVVDTTGRQKRLYKMESVFLVRLVSVFQQKPKKINKA